ncbi:MAG: flagellar biosynthetic protein FliQ [Verrucomicrobia bacterium]|nr:flagellar biosynthetic protein FliQ [Verrucomicrobiota bacterium]
MNAEFAIEMLKGLMLQSVTMVAPILLTGMMVGLSVALFQAVTSIHEQTLTFVPKALGVAAIMVVLMPWFVRSLSDYTIAIIERMPHMVK